MNRVFYLRIVLIYIATIIVVCLTVSGCVKTTGKLKPENSGMSDKQKTAGSNPANAKQHTFEILFTRDGNIWSMQEDGSNQINITEDLDGFFISPTRSPDKKHIACIGEPEMESESYSGLLIMDTDGKNVKVVNNNISFGRIAWSPDGKWIAYIDNSANDEVIPILFQPFLAEVKELTTIRGFYGLINNVSWSPDGKCLVFGMSYNEDDSVFGQIGIIEIETGRLLLKSKGNTESMPAWSHDGKRIAFFRWGPSWIYLMTMAPDGSDEQQICRFENLGYDFMPTRLKWSPDGSYLIHSWSYSDYEVEQVQANQTYYMDFHYTNEISSIRKTDFKTGNTQILTLDGSEPNP